MVVEVGVCCFVWCFVCCVFLLLIRGLGGVSSSSVSSVYSEFEGLGMWVVWLGKRFIVVKRVW